MFSFNLLPFEVSKPIRQNISAENHIKLKFISKTFSNKNWDLLFFDSKSKFENIQDNLTEDLIDIYINFEDKYFLFKILCRNNNLKVLKYLVDTFNITKTDAKSYDVTKN